MRSIVPEGTTRRHNLEGLQRGMYASHAATENGLLRSLCLRDLGDNFKEALLILADAWKKQYEELFPWFRIRRDEARKPEQSR